MNPAFSRPLSGLMARARTPVLPRGTPSWGLAATLGGVWKLNVWGTAGMNPAFSGTLSCLMARVRTAVLHRGPRAWGLAATLGGVWKREVGGRAGLGGRCSTPRGG